MILTPDFLARSVKSLDCRSCIMILSESVRFFRRNRILSVSAICIIALGMAASSIVLNVLLSLLNQRIGGIERRTYVTIAEPSAGGLLRPVSWETVRLLAPTLNAVSLGAYAEPISGSVKIDSRQYPIRVAAVSPDFFARFSKPLSAGTGLSHSEESANGLNVVVLSPKLATDLFGSPVKALDQFVTINGASLRVTGIAPGEFHGLFGKETDAWIPPNCAVPVYATAVCFRQSCTIGFRQVICHRFLLLAVFRHSVPACRDSSKASSGRARQRVPGHVAATRSDTRKS